MSMKGNTVDFSQRDRIILRALQRPHISYQQIGDRFGITRERVRQIREKLIKAGETVPPRWPAKNIDAIRLLQNEDLTYSQLEELTGLTRQRLIPIAHSLRKRGIDVPRRNREGQRPLIIHLLKTDGGRQYGRNKRIAKQLGVTLHYVAQTKYEARKQGKL